MNDELIVLNEELEYNQEALYEECILIEDEYGYAEIHRTVSEDVTCYYTSFEELIEG